jgi:hypothetical protein
MLSMPNSWTSTTRSSKTVAGGWLLVAGSTSD